MAKELSPEETLVDAYGDGLPLVMLVDGKPRSAVISLLNTDDGLWYLDDGFFDEMPSRPAVHFVEGTLEGTGPWRCGDRHVIVSPTRQDREMAAWDLFVRLAGSNFDKCRVRAEYIIGDHDLMRRKAKSK